MQSLSASKIVNRGVAPSLPKRNGPRSMRMRAGPERRTLAFTDAPARIGRAELADQLSSTYGIPKVTPGGWIRSNRRTW